MTGCFHGYCVLTNRIESCSRLEIAVKKTLIGGLITVVRSTNYKMTPKGGGGEKALIRKGALTCIGMRALNQIIISGILFFTQD